MFTETNPTATPGRRTVRRTVSLLTLTQPEQSRGHGTGLSSPVSALLFGIYEVSAGAGPLADSGRDRHPGARHRLPLRARSGGAEMAMDQLGIGGGNRAMDLGLDRLHDLRLEGRELRQDLRLAWRRHHSAALVLSDRLCHPRRGGTERGDQASNHAGEARSGTPCSLNRAVTAARPRRAAEGIINCSSLGPRVGASGSYIGSKWEF